MPVANANIMLPQVVEIIFAACNFPVYFMYAMSWKENWLGMLGLDKGFVTRRSCNLKVKKLSVF